MKKIGCVLTLLLCVFLGACSSNTYERDTSKGKTESITLEEMVMKMEDKDTFAVAFTQELCGYCSDYHAMLKEYLKKHNVTMYEVNLTAEPLSESENLAIIRRYFPSFSATPGIYYANEGKLVNSLTDEKKPITETLFDEWVQTNKLDEKK